MSIELNEQEMRVLTIALGLAKGALHYIDPDQGPAAHLLREVENLSVRITEQTPDSAQALAG